MKPHLILTLRPEASQIAAPHWAEVIQRKPGVPTRIHPEIDRILDRHHIPVWVTSEYAPHASAWSLEEIASGLNRIYRLILQTNSSIPSDLIREIHLVPVVESVRAGTIARAPLPDLTPRAMSAVAGLKARDAIRLDDAHEYTRGDSSITIAVLDTGVRLKHPELKSALDSGFDFVEILEGSDKFIGDYMEADPIPEDEVGHGTHVAGIIAGRGLKMPEGVAPSCRILPVRVLAAMQRGEKRFGAGLVDNINAGIKWAIDQKADVINASLGIRNEGGGLPHEEVVNYAKRRGVTIVAASGNDGTEQMYYPGALPHVIAVGAADNKGGVAPFSTFGHQVSLIAPGVDIYSSYLEDDYAFSTGTSHAAPFVAGGVALLKSFAKSLGRRLSDAQIKHVLKHTADKIGREFKHPKAGFGNLNLADAMRYLEYRLAA
jgi:subtilisin family serine protease